MGTTFSVTVVGETLSADSAERLRAAIDDLLASLDAMMSTYDSGSEVSRFNALTSSDWFPVSAETATVFLRSKEISEVTGGAFDVTVGPLVDAWGFGPAGPQPTPPSDADIARLLMTVGFAQIEVDEATPAIRKTHVSVRSDLSAVAKGYAVDRVADLLDGGGYDAYLIEIGRRDSNTRAPRRGAALAGWHRAARRRAVLVAAGDRAQRCSLGDVWRLPELHRARWRENLPHDRPENRPARHACARLCQRDRRPVRSGRRAGYGARGARS